MDLSLEMEVGTEQTIRVVKCGRCSTKLGEVSCPDRQFITVGSANIYTHVRLICVNCGSFREFKPANLGWSDSDLTPEQQKISRAMRRGGFHTPFEEFEEEF